MQVQERKEKLSMIARGMVGDTFDDKGNIDWETVKGMAAVKEITIEEREIGGVITRNIKVKLLNPVESIAELNKMEQVYRITERSERGPTINNYFLTDPSVQGKMERIGERTLIEVTGKVVENSG